MLKLYNTLSKKIEEFTPQSPPVVKMYTCGPTVYDAAHIGHFRTYTNTDILRRILEFNNYSVLQVMNITDVGHLVGDRDMGEDKIEIAAKRTHKNAWQITKFYEEDFWQALEKLNIKKPHIICRATEHVKEMISLIKNLDKKGYVYKTSDGIYFDTSRFPKYNRLSHLPLDKLKEGARIEENPQKKNPTDFALWKFSPKNAKRQMEWQSPWGKGFPGWHIECSAMSIKYLGKTVDIHTGGIEHIAVHHTNEIAQSESATGRTFVKYWFHNNHLLVNGRKMSKSLNNFFNQKDIERRNFSLIDCRYLFLNAHYRHKLNFTWNALKGAKASIEKLRVLIRSFRETARQKKRISLSDDKMKKIDNYRSEFISAVNNDLTIPSALSIFWQVVKSNMPSQDKLELIFEFDKVFGLNLQQMELKSVKIPQTVRQMAEERERFRKEKKWQEADKIRKEIESRGFVIEDTSKGPQIRKS